MMVEFVIPNRDDPSQATPTLYERWGALAVPREGESVTLNGRVWRVKWVEHTFSLGDGDEARGHTIRVRLIEPDHWTQQ